MKLKKLSVLAVCLLTGTSLMLGGCSGGTKAPAGEKILRVATGAEPESLDPRKGGGTPEGYVLRQIFEGLTTQDAKGAAVPGAAERWEISPDGLTYKFYLRTNAKWSNGDPVTAKDFEAAWKTVLSPEFGSRAAEQLYCIKNGEAYNKKQVSAEQVGVRALDEKTLEVTLEYPTPYFLSLAAYHAFYPVQQKTAESNAKWSTDPQTTVGNGPFKIVKWEHNNKIQLVKNDQYWNKDVVKLAKVDLYLADNYQTILNMFESRQVDTVEVSPPSAEIPRLLKENKLKTSPFLVTYFYALNTTRPPFDNVKVRKAFGLALDRKAIVDSVTKGGEKPALAWIPFGLPDAQAGSDFRQTGGDLYGNNEVETARKLLAEAGYPDGKGLPPVTLLFNTNEFNKAIAEAVQEMWRKNLGVTVQLMNQEWKVYLQTRNSGDYQVARNGWLGKYSDPMTFLEGITTGNSNNYMRWSNPEYDRLVKEAQTSNDSAARMKAMHTAEKILVDEMPVIPIYFYTNKIMEQPNVKGIIRDALGAFYLREADVQ
ncbi:MAG TPA: peptide ABC transporter substrate-binding protein [Patescibacteria group bacterium]|nr:peptide ABC transporter substrate-binding protein [Patescibacteria group bacterium]